MSTVNGIITQKVSSTLSSPTVHYAASYSASRSDASHTAVSVSVTLTAWLNSAASRLGTGIKLTAFVRINGGAWQSVVIKNASVSWSGTSRHSVNVTLSASAASDRAQVEWYVSRVGSAYGGTAGTLGSREQPQSCLIALPPYVSDSSADADIASGVLRVNVGGSWRNAVPYVRTAGVWRQSVPYVKTRGVWHISS